MIFFFLRFETLLINVGQSFAIANFCAHLIERNCVCVILVKVGQIWHICFLLTTYQWSKWKYLPKSQVWSLCSNYEYLPDRRSRRVDVVKSDLVRNYGVNKLSLYLCLTLLLLSSSIGLNLNLGRIELHWTWNYHEGERELVYYKRHYVIFTNEFLCAFC